MSVALYAGSFDPVTRGHQWMVAEGARLFDRLIVAIGDNPDKTYTFSIQERLGFLEQTVVGLENCRVDHFANRFLVDYAREVGADVILRGIRNENDYTFERVMRNINDDLNPDVTTVFLMPPREIAEVSSSMVKGLVGPEGWEEVVAGHVSASVLEGLRQKHAEHGVR